MHTLAIRADLNALARISTFITQAAEQANLDTRATWQVQLAVDEAATNITQHAYDEHNPGDIIVSWQHEHDRFIVTLCDHGRRFDPNAIPAPNLEAPLEERQVGGLGVYLITRLMDEVRFDFDPQEGNVLTMVKYIGSSGANEITTLPVKGRVDANTAPDLSAHIHALIEGGARYVLLDFSDTTFLSSSGLRALLLMRKELMTLGGELRLAALQPQVYEVFTLTGFSQVFAIHPSVDEARSAFGRGNT